MRRLACLTVLAVSVALGAQAPRFDLITRHGSLDIAQQMTTLVARGLAVNIGGYIGFNSAWQTVTGNADKRPTPAEIDQRRALIARGLEPGPRRIPTWRASQVLAHRSFPAGRRKAGRTING